MLRSKSSIIIGGGIGGLGSACLLAKTGWDVTVLEKNNQLGGRVGLFETKGFKFDTGPSWFLMKDIYEHFFELLGEDLHKHLKLKKLTPSYRVFYKDTNKEIDIWPDLIKNLSSFEKNEPGAGKQLKHYLAKVAYQYSVAKDRFLYKNYDSMNDFLTREMITKGRKLNMLSNMHKDVEAYFKTAELQKILEFPSLFLGSPPHRTPALFGIMNHFLLNQGVFYPAGGMYEIVNALVRIAKKNGVKFGLNAPVKKILVKDGRATGVEMANSKRLMANLVISNADMHHTETALLEPKYRTKSDKYWQKCTLAPSALLLYLGIKGKLPSLDHHNLLFCKDWQQNFKEIFDKNPPAGLRGSEEPSGSRMSRWPSDPSFYVCCPSKTDSSVAPKDHENLFALVPIPAGLEYTNKQLEIYADKILATMESSMNLPGLHRKIVYKQMFAVRDFAKRYNSYRGSALGLAHTLLQTAAFRPNNTSKKVKNLYYVGASTNPGIGIPPALISAELMYKRLVNNQTSSFAT